VKWNRQPVLGLAIETLSANVRAELVRWFYNGMGSPPPLRVISVSGASSLSVGGTKVFFGVIPVSGSLVVSTGGGGAAQTQATSRCGTRL